MTTTTTIRPGKIRLDNSFKFLLRKKFPIKRNDLMDLTRLKIRGGLKNLSANLDTHLYNK